MLLPLLSLLCMAIAAPPKDPLPVGPIYEGPDTVAVDILRPGRGDFRPKIFVHAMLSDGKPAVFMVDTGADISAVSEDVAERLSLVVERDWGHVEGLGGRASLHHAVLPEVRIGDAVVRDVDVGVDLPNVPTQFGLMPIDGILGANVWSRFVLEIDYPRDRLILHRPGTYDMPKDAAKLFFDGTSIYARVHLVADTGDVADSVLQVDTGAAEVILFGPDAFPYEGGSLGAPWTEGLEAVMGIGGADTMPPSAYLRTTRRIALEKVGIGGEIVKVDDLRAKWLPDRRGPGDITGLAGHVLFENHVTTIDYHGQSFALGHHRLAPKRRLDAYQVLLDDDLARYGDDPSRDLFRGKMYVGLDDLERGEALLAAVAERADDPEDAAEARMLLAATRRMSGDLAGAYEAIAFLTPAELVEQGQIIATVNGFVLDGKTDDGLALADRAIAEYTERAGADYEASIEADAHVARADALFAQGRVDAANDALLEAATLLDNPDAHLLRRARVALAAGDHYGAMAHIRRLIDLYPPNGQYLWFYATLLRDENDRATFKSDMDHAMGLLHQGDQPYDYMAHAFHLLGDDAQANRTMNVGLERDCEPPKGHRRDGRSDAENCRAWYYAMTGVEPDRALALIDGALAREGDRSDYLDTKAMVHVARGEYDLAYASAIHAARLSPDDVYMLWQAERIGQIARESGNVSTRAGVP